MYNALRSNGLPRRHPILLLGHVARRPEELSKKGFAKKRRSVRKSLMTCVPVFFMRKKKTASISPRCSVRISKNVIKVSHAYEKTHTRRKGLFDGPSLQRRLRWLTPRAWRARARPSFFISRCGKARGKAHTAATC